MPRLFSFEAARNFIKGKLDFFTALYQFMDNEQPKLRELAALMFVKIISKIPKGAYAFNLITKAATNQAQKSNKAPYDELICSLSNTANPQLQYNTLNFINLIIYKAPSEKKKAQFLARLENLGLYDELHRMGRENGGDAKIVK